MLAMKSVLAESTNLPILIFDEIDIDAFDNDKIIFCVNQKFYRDWIIQYFVNNNKLLDAICEISPEIKSLKIIYKEEE